MARIHSLMGAASMVVLFFLQEKTEMEGVIGIVKPGTGITTIHEDGSTTHIGSVIGGFPRIRTLEERVDALEKRAIPAEELKREIYQLRLDVNKALQNE